MARKTNSMSAVLTYLAQYYSNGCKIENQRKNGTNKPQDANLKIFL